MAHGWAHALHGHAIEVRSAGVSPGTLNQDAVLVMREAGVDISGQVPVSLADLAEERFDLVITVCDRARGACPVFADAPRVLHVPFDDPPTLALGALSIDERLRPYRRVRDEIREFVESLPVLLQSALQGAREISPVRDP